MTPLFRKLIGMNWLLFAVMISLAAFGVVAIYSCTYMREAAAYNTMWRKQAVWIAISTAVFFITSLVDYRWVKWGALPMYLMSVALLVVTLIIGKKIDGARCWLQFGPIQFQPAQFAVLSGILVLALFLSQFRTIHPALKALACTITVGAPALLILIQPSLGSAIIWFPVLFAMLFVARLPLRYLIVMVLIGLTCAPLAYYFKLKAYQQKRIIAFIDPQIDAHGSSWAVNQTLIAIGSGGWAGKGFLAHNTQIELGYVPQTTLPNDYIYSAIGEQWGFVGGVIVVSAFAVLIMTCVFVAYKSGDELGLLVVVGVVMLIFTHTLQNIGMNISILPVTGVPLPLISYSGSFVAVIMFGLGLVNSVWVHRKALA